MKWTRDTDAGQYTSGPYMVEKVYEPGRAGHTWFASGPGLGEPCDSLSHGKALCLRASETRGDSAVPVVGDRVLILVGLIRKAGTVTAVLPGEHQPTYVVRLPRGRRRCAYRAELMVVPS